LEEEEEKGVLEREGAGDDEVMLNPRTPLV